MIKFFAITRQGIIHKRQGWFINGKAQGYRLTPRIHRYKPGFDQAPRRKWWVATNTIAPPIGKPDAKSSFGNPP